MAKQEQILIIQPQHELKFRGSLKAPITSFITLKNPSEHRVCFKIKTTAPKRYCVRPNSGILQPNATMEIAVSLHPFDFDPNEKHKHKFMVQTMIAPEGEINVDQLWKEVSPENLMDSKLKCVFEAPPESSGTATTNSTETTTNTEDKTKRIGDSPSVNQFGELVKAAQEVKHLREEESSLRQENLKLKEEILRLRADQAISRYNPPTTPALNPPETIPPLRYIGFAIAAGLFGYFLAKFLL